MTTTNTMSAAEIETHNIHRLLRLVLDVKGAMQRTALTYGTLRRVDTLDLRIAVDAALSQGLVTFKISNSRFEIMRTDGLIYLTKAGKAWLRAQGDNFGAAKFWDDMNRYSKHRAAVAGRVVRGDAQICTKTGTPLVAAAEAA